MAATVADGWEPALAAALLGAERAPAAQSEALLPDLGSGAEPGGALLARLAAHSVHHLAGSAYSAEALEPVEPRAEHGPECPPAAALRLFSIVTEGSLSRWSSSQWRLKEWCALAQAAGVRAPIWLLPLLAPHRDELSDAIDGVADAELDWLARACAGSAEESASERRAGETDWTEGDARSRRSAFVAFRQRDPDAARAALQAGFKGEKADLRQAFVSALEIGLTEADEPFLEACLDDRASGVRAAAQALLPRLTGSRFATRMAARAQAALRIETKKGLLGGAKHALVVTLPEESPELARDGIAPNAYDRQGGGRRAGLLRDILSTAPLHAFAAHSPRLWIELALRSEWPTQVFEGFYASVRGERDAAWARDMNAVLEEAHAGRLAGVPRTNPLLEMWARATDLLPDAEWELAVTALLKAKKIEPVLAMIGKGPMTYSEVFTAAFLDWLALVTRGSSSLRADIAKSWVLDRLHERLHPGDDIAASAAAILARLPEDTEDRLRQQLSSLVETLELRATIRREFA